MALNSFKRYEKKFLLTEAQYDQIIKRLVDYMDYDKHCINNNFYNIYSIYYDTEYSDVIRHSVEHPYYKEKLRLRSYDIVKCDKDIVFLEMKKKINGIISKRRAVLTYGEADAFFSRGIKPETCDYITKQVLDEMEYYLKNNKVRPKIFICYERIALFGKENRNFRVSFDRKISSRRGNVNLKCRDTDTSIIDSTHYLMEVKFIGAVPLWFANLLSELKIYKSSFSKYGREFEEYCKEKVYDENYGQGNDENRGERKIC